MQAADLGYTCLAYYTSIKTYIEKLPFSEWNVIDYVYNVLYKTHTLYIWLFMGCLN